MNSFALCDVDPSQWDRTMWLGLADGAELRAIALIYFGPGGTFVNVVGEQSGSRELLTQAADIVPRKFHLSLEAELDEQMRIEGRTLQPVQNFKRMIPGDAPEDHSQHRNIVQLAAADAPRIRSLLVAQGANPSAWFQEHTLASGLYRGWIERGELAGVVGVHAWSEEQRIAVVGNLGVLPSERRNGIGRILMETILAELRARGWDVAFNVLVDNRAALALYAQMGCHEVGIVREFRVS